MVLRRQRRALLVILGAGYCFSAAPVRAVPLSITLQGSRSAERVAVELRATDAVTGHPAGAWAIDVSGEPRTLDLSVPASAQWRVQARANGYWSSGVAVTGVAGAAIALVRTTTVVGKMVGPQRLPTGSHLTLAFQPGRTADSKEVDSFPHQLPCVVDGNAWACPVPVGTWDLRLSLPGSAPVYRWAQRLDDARQVDLGATVFKAGASVSGWVLSGNTSEALAAVVEMVPLAQHADLDRADRRAPLLRRMLCDDRGFFQISDVTPGEYWLQAELRGLVSQRVKATLVSANETRLSEHLDLRPPQLTEVVLEPAVDAYGKPWSVYLYIPAGLGERSFLEHSRGVVGADGRWRSPRRLATTAVVKVLDSKGSTWAAEPVDASVEPPALVSIAIPLVRVRGVLSFDGSGIGGTIFFGGSRGVESIRVEADSEGRFEGALPRAGRWLLEVELSEGALVALEDVEISPPRNGKPANVDIDLPATRIRGRVVESGRAVRALIVATRDDGKGSLGGRAFSGETQVDGTWELIAIPPGRVTLYAHAADSESERLTLDIAEDTEPPEILLELQRKGKTRAWLTDGVNAVAGGLINTRPSDGLGRRLTSAVDGSFWIEYSTSSSRVDMIVVPPSAGASLATLLPRSGTEPVIVVQPAAGSLIVPSLDGWLAWQGVVVPMALVFSAFDATGRFDVVPGQGYRLHGLAGGSWTWCPEGGGSCGSAEINGTGDVRIDRPQPKSST